MKTATNETVLDLVLERKRKEFNKVVLREWNDKQFEEMQRKISLHFKRTWESINEELGLAYTSSSSYAAYWVCNLQLYHYKFPSFYYIGFAIDSNEKYYAVLWDKDENELIIEI